MKNLYILLTLGLLLGCSKKAVEQEDPTTAPLKARTIGGEWVSTVGGAGGTGNFDSFKNFQYNFEVGGNNQKVDINLSSKEINVQFALFDPNGTRIDNSSVSRLESETYTLNAGKYRLVVCADRRAVGKFSFIIQGILGDPVKIPSQILQSNTQNFGASGGGGNVYTFKNHFYTFEVTEDNFSVDIELESSDTNIELLIYDPLGQKLTNSFFSERYRFKTLAVKKGIYTIMSATDIRGGVGNYHLNVFGKVQNLQRVVSQVTTIKGNWANNSSSDTYALQLTANSAPLDMELSSADAKGFIDLQTSTGSRIMYSVVASNNEVLIKQNMAKGEYRIVVAPGKNQGSGNYTLTVNGQYSDFKKL
ncbi:MAG: hypothetical protein V4585_08255 [Bacteroidota bacterium]|jgi:hypothetical protein